MATSAKKIDPHITSKVVNAILKDVFEQIDNMEVARGMYLAKAREYQDKISGIYERAAYDGIPQRVMRMQVRLEKLQRRARKLIADLELENQRILQKVAKVRGDKAQLALFPEVKAKKVRANAKTSDRTERAETAGAARGDGEAHRNQ